MKKNHKSAGKKTFLLSLHNKVPGVRNPGLAKAPPAADAVDYTAAGALLLIHTLLFLLVDFLIGQNIPGAHIFSSARIASFIISALLTQGLLIFIPSISIIAIYKMPSDSITGARPMAGSLILGLAAGIPAAVVFHGLNNLLIYALVHTNWQLPVIDTPYSFSAGLLWQAPWKVRLVILIVSALIPALVEELMFRGAIQSSLSARGPGRSAIIWQAVAFTLFHNDPLFLLPPLLSGLLLGYLRYKSQSIIPAVLCHISLNITLLAINPLLPSLTRKMLEISAQTSLSLLYASLIAACVAAVALVPLLLLISGLSRRHRQPADKSRLYPGDWKFGLAIVIMIATILVKYYNRLP